MHLGGVTYRTSGGGVCIPNNVARARIVEAVLQHYNVQLAIDRDVTRSIERLITGNDPGPILDIVANAISTSDRKHEFTEQTVQAILQTVLRSPRNYRIFAEEKLLTSPLPTRPGDSGVRYVDLRLQSKGENKIWIFELKIKPRDFLQLPNDVSALQHSEFVNYIRTLSLQQLSELKVNKKEKFHQNCTMEQILTQHAEPQLLEYIKILRADAQFQGYQIFGYTAVLVGGCRFHWTQLRDVRAAKK